MEHREMDRQRETYSCGMTERRHWTKHGEMDRNCMEQRCGLCSDQDSHRRRVGIKVRRRQLQTPPEPRSRRRPLRDPDPIQTQCKLIGDGDQLNAITATEWDIFQETARNREEKGEK